jgi:GxxExxY protein
MENSAPTWTERQYNHVSGRIIKLALEVHTALGPGLLESAYEQCLADDLSCNGLRVRTQVDIPITYKGRTIESGYRADMIVEEKIIVELKSVGKLLPVHESQLLTYLQLSECKLGLLINFNVSRLKYGIRRFANGL